MEKSTCRDAMVAFRELVRPRDEKDQHGKTQEYRANKDSAWKEARHILGRAEAL
jgi:hypothetical protein